MPVDSKTQDGMLSPSLPQEQTLILRLDGIKAFEFSDIAMKTVDDTLARDMSITLGMIPQNIGSDEKISEYILEKAGDDRVEIAQYETLSFYLELQVRNDSDVYTGIRDGKEVLVQMFGVSPTTFVSSVSEYREDASKALSDLGFSVISAVDGQYKFDGKIMHIGHTVSTNSQENRLVVVGSENKLVNEMVAKCMDSIKKINICVISLHPRDFASIDNRSLDEQKYSEFIDLLEALRALDVKSAKFSDLIA